MTRASDLARLIGAGATINDGTTISTADNTTQLTLTSTDADASVGPALDLYRNSGSPADSDLIGDVRFQGENDAGETITYANIAGLIGDASDGTEDGILRIQQINAGSAINRISVNTSETVINDSSKDLDFRVESDNNTHALFIDSGNDKIGMFTDSPSGKLHIKTTSSGGTAQSRSALVIEDDGGNADSIQFLSNDSGFHSIFFGDASDNDVGRIAYSHSGDTMRFNVAASERVRISSDGVLLIGKTQAGAEFEGLSLGAGFGTFTRNSGIPMFINRHSDDGTLIEFRQANTNEGTISVSGTTVSYNGGHLSRWSQLTENTRDVTIVKGTVMTNLDQMAEWTTDGVTEDNEQLNCMAVSSVEGDINVAGVFVNWDNDDKVYTNDMNVAMTGDMVIRIAKGTTIARGDLLMSAGDGTAKPQGDDIVRSKTVAKVTSTNVSHTYNDGTYLVPCVLMAC